MPDIPVQCHNRVSHAKSVRRNPYGEHYITGSACCGPPRAEESQFRGDISRTAAGSLGADERNSSEGFGNMTGAELSIEAKIELIQEA